MEIYFECTKCKEVEPINITALSANGFRLQCSVCKTYFTFGVVAVEQSAQCDGTPSPVTLSGLFYNEICTCIDLGDGWKRQVPSCKVHGRIAEREEMLHVAEHEEMLHGAEPHQPTAAGTPLKPL